MLVHHRQYFNRTMMHEDAAKHPPPPRVLVRNRDKVLSNICYAAALTMRLLRVERFGLIFAGQLPVCDHDFTVSE
jgi:hypothetical protein